MIAVCDLFEHLRRVYELEDAGYDELQYDSDRQRDILAQLEAIKDSSGEPLGSIMQRVLPVCTAVFSGDPRELRRKVNERWTDIDRFRATLRTIT